MIKLYYYKSMPNFGDLLSPIVVEWISKQRVRLASPEYRGKHLAVGSLMHRIKSNDIVWGTGCMYDQEIIAPRGSHFLAVRGPLTRDLIKQAYVPQIYGDPALLMPRIYTPRPIGYYKIGLIPHYVDQGFFDIKSKDILFIDVTNPNPLKTIDQIISCDVVISTSLHGIIVAEAYGVPAIWLEVSDKIRGAGFKFRDYFASTHRDITEPIRLNGLVTDEDLFRISDKILPKGYIDLEPLIKAWK